MNKDPLDVVFGELEELEGPAREKLARLIVPFVKIHAESGKIGFNQDASARLGPKQKILVFLLARLALSTRNPAHPAALPPKQIESETDMPGGTVRPKLADLVKERIVFKDESGKYSVRPSSISRAEVMLLDFLPRGES